MFLPIHPLDGSKDPVASIPKVLLYTWFSVFAALMLMGGYLMILRNEFRAADAMTPDTIEPGVAMSLKNYLAVRPHKRARSRGPILKFRCAAPDLKD